MPRVDATPLTITRDGAAPAYVAPTGDQVAFANTGRRFLHVKNASAAPINVTAITPGTVDGQAIADRVTAVPAAGERFIGPFPADIYNQGDGKVYIDFSAQAGVTYALLAV